jgi:hippurate hydrolase
VYRQIHQHPELGNQEVKTAALAADTLQKAGYDVREKIGTTGVVGVLKNGNGPVVLMRADMDALPVQEQTGLPYASKDHAHDASGDVPVAHACGHDVHVATLMGAARLLAAEKAAWHGTFIALFQPAEELGSGADVMLKGGLARSIPKPDVALAQHVLPYPAGMVGTHDGPFLSTADSMRITVFGRGSHGSMPQLSVDPVVLAAMIVLRLQTVVAREVAPGEFAVLTIGSIRAGTKSNIIGDRAVLELNIRAYSDSTRTLLINAIKRIVKAECAASASPREPAFELYDHYPLTSNDPGVTAKVASAFHDYFGAQATTVPRQSASEDFSEIPAALGVPYTYWSLGGMDAKKWHAAEASGTLATAIPANHSPEFAPVIQPTLRTGTAAIVAASLAWLAS